MSYYNDKRTASSFIKGYALKGYSFKNIENKIFIDYGFGKRFVIQELQRYDELGYIKFNSETLTITLIKQPKKEEVKQDDGIKQE